MLDPCRGCAAGTPIRPCAITGVDWHRPSSGEAAFECTAKPVRTVSGICGAFPGGCGFGRRKRITIKVAIGRTPNCQCGSELIRVKEVQP